MTHSRPPVAAAWAAGILLAISPFQLFAGSGRLEAQHGGLLFASGALNAEFVLATPKGHYQIFFTDPAGEELPASVATDVSLSLKRGAATESLPLHIDNSGEAWTGSGIASDAALSAARLTYKLRGKPEQTDIPFQNGSHAEFRTVPPKPKAEETVQLEFTIRDFFGRAVPNLQIEHTKPMHLMVVSRDLSEFHHIHPEPAPGALFRVPHSFAHGGDYRLYVDYTPLNGSNRIQAFDLNLAGTPAPKVPLVPTASWNTILDGIRMVLTADKPLSAGTDIGFTMTMTDASTNSPVRNLQPYLGAWAHIAIISEDTQEFLHVHPAEEPGQSAVTYAQRGGPTPSAIGTRTGFRKPGLYKMWVQVQRSGKVSSIPFIFRVGAGGGNVTQGPKVPAGATLVNVGSGGFDPAHLRAKAGQPLKLAFYRSDAQNCANTVIFPDLGIRKDLPPGQTVVIDVMPQKTGSLGFSCGMKMFRGELLVQ